MKLNWTTAVMNPVNDLPFRFPFITVFCDEFSLISLQSILSHPLTRWIDASGVQSSFLVPIFDFLPACNILFWENKGIGKQMSNSITCGAVFCLPYETVIFSWSIATGEDDWVDVVDADKKHVLNYARP